MPERAFGDRPLKIFLFFAFFLSCYTVMPSAVLAEAAISERNLTADVLPAPTLIKPNKTSVNGPGKSLIIGLTKSDTRVKVFIDGAYNGQTEILADPSGTANFSYRPFLHLAPGKHEVYAIAENSGGEASPASAISRFTIELAFPAPTLLKPLINASAASGQTVIVGLAKNDSKIQIYVDKKFSGEFTVKNDQSGTANFAYRPASNLSRGQHLVYAVAIDRRGKISSWSNLTYISMKTAAIAQSAKAENRSAVSSIKEPPPAVNEKNAPLISNHTGLVESEELSSAENRPAAPNGLEKLSDGEKSNSLMNLIGGVQAEADNSATGLIDESRNNQGRLKISLVLFILFLVGVVAWLLWVNRELIKERRAQLEAEENEAGRQNKLL
ncbi:MAG: hypothetical protein Q8O93_02120 [bacterium]|nr:hypothetical protein [bacterium]